MVVKTSLGLCFVAKGVETSRCIAAAEEAAYSRETSRPKMYDFIQSMQTRTRLRAKRACQHHQDQAQEIEDHLLLKHMLKYADLQKKYVSCPPVAKFPVNHEISATAFSDPIYASEP